MFPLLAGGFLHAQSKSDESDFAGKIAKFREDYKATLLSNPYAPLKSKAELTKLNFFPARSAYRFNGKFLRTPQAKTTKMATSDGGTSEFVKYGEVIFRHESIEHRLSIFKLLHPTVEYFLIAFTDLTNGKSTYGGGRYLDFSPDQIADGQIEIDFNKSYNPWCHYSDQYPCPLPPKENHLSIAIPVGEGLYSRD